jgi:hypothetical protein
VSQHRDLEWIHPGAVVLQTPRVERLRPAWLQRICRKEIAMSSTLSVVDVVARLQAQAAYHRERAAFHAQQEDLHREKRTGHEAELAGITQCLEAFQAAAAPALDLARRPPVPVVESAPQDLDLGPKPSLSKLVGAVVRGFAPTERFGASAVAREIDRRFGAGLRKRADPRLVSIALRRLADAGRIHQVRRGRPHWEALYARERPAAPG